jgi:hypothetical protein
VIDFVLNTRFEDLDHVVRFAQRCLLDLIVAPL